MKLCSEVEDVQFGNADNLGNLFATDELLKLWLSDQKCSNYEKRCRLRRAALQCGLHEAAGIAFIRIHIHKMKTIEDSDAGKESMTKSHLFHKQFFQC